MSLLSFGGDGTADGALLLPTKAAPPFPLGKTKAETFGEADNNNIIVIIDNRVINDNNDDVIFLSSFFNILDY